ncbi:MAG: DegT/DnrJ/EryC1/StrS family aminotransferase [bacterium]|nr:DegT/DnrJ/EryC1/StrS family aminotransferase [bacterium]
MKTLFTGFAPNLRRKDVFLAMKYMLAPWTYKNWADGDSVVKVEKWLTNFYKLSNAITIDSGRSALLLGLEAIDIKKGDEVILQGFTCVVVVNAIKTAGAKPVYVDVDNTFNISVTDLRNKINGNTKAVIVQHTFGVPADMDSIVDICNHRSIKIIEDCAHSLGSMYKGQKVGTFGDFAILSFGSDKCISCVRGGAIITNNPDIALRVRELKNKLPKTRRLNIVQDLFHYTTFFKGKLMYSFYIGKLILALAKKLNITGRIIYDCEKHGEPTDFYPAQFANCLADLLLLQLNDFDMISEHRKKIAQIYKEKIKNAKVLKPLLTNGSIPLRYNLLTSAPDVLSIIAKNQKVILGDWYRGVVAPLDIDMSKIGYSIGSCPVAESFANKSVNLPTNINISVKDANRIVNIINKY